MPTQSQKYMNFNEIATKFLEFYDASMTREYGNYLNAKEFARLVLVGGRQEIEKNIAEYRNDIKSINCDKHIRRRICGYVSTKQVPRTLK